MAKHALKPVHPTHNKMKLIIPIVVAGAILSSTAVVAQADTGQNNPLAVASVTPDADVAPQIDTALSQASVVTEGVISVPTTVKINYERTVVTSIAAPKPVEPPAPVAPEASQPAVAVATTPTAVAEAAAAAVSPTNPANIPADPAGKGVAGASDSFGSKIAAAALAQIGVEQDCTMLVTNSLKAVGINFHGWPADYLSLGQVTTTPVAGDLIYYKNGGTGLGHIAVFIGNYGGKSGMAVHGGWEGHTTKIFSANVGSGPIYIHVNR